MSSTHRRRLRFEPLEDRRLLAIIPVTTTTDESNGTGLVSLREAVGMANTGDTITFSVNGTIQLLGGSVFGQIAIGKSITIQGPGANLLTVRAFDPDAGGTNDSDGSRVFLVEDSFFTLNVTISGLTLTNGDPQVDDENGGGGAIFNRENLTLNNCVLSGNFSPNGGSIYNDGGTLAINDCTISANNALADAAGILIQGGSLVINRTTISNNQATNSGGAVLSRGRPVTITDSTITGNSSDEYGGGIYQYQGLLSVSGSTISSNAADNNHDGTGSGGGIYKQSGSLSVVNSTISGNSASGDGGGGIFSNTNQTINITHSTITGNVVADLDNTRGGGINSATTASLDHTIIGGNLRGATTRDDVSGSFNAYYSLVGDKGSETVNNTGGSLIGTTLSPVNAMLGPLANNGGLTFTHALLNGSPALEAGDPAAVAGSGAVPQFDQRGTPFSRVVDFDGGGGARIDMGAVEMVAVGPTLVGDYNLNHSVDAADYVLWRKTLNTSVAMPNSGADGDGSGVIDPGDYTVWRSNFGDVLSPGAGSGLPEDEALSSELSISDSTSGSATAAVAVTSLAPTIDEMESNRVLSRESQTTVSGTALDLLLTLESFYSAADPTDGGLTDRDSDAGMDHASVDAALDESCIPIGLAIDLRPGL
jgi:hypothetical protein